MAEVTVTEFAKVLKVPVDRLLVQLDEAGIKVAGANDMISDDAKLELLTHLKKRHGRKEAEQSAPSRITLAGWCRLFHSTENFITGKITMPTRLSTAVSLAARFSCPFSISARSPSSLRTWTSLACSAALT